MSEECPFWVEGSDGCNAIARHGRVWPIELSIEVGYMGTTDDAHPRRYRCIASDRNKMQACYKNVREQIDQRTGRYDPNVPPTSEN